MNKPLRLAIDGNEANVKQRVGSNVYAFEVIKQLYELTQNPKQFDCMILLAHPNLDDLPPVRSNWQYKILAPARLWTQWALPLYLFWQQQRFDLLYTPGHYAPRFSAIPYVSSVMDLAFLEFPEQFQKKDLHQLKHWTYYSVSRASKVITISEFSKRQIHTMYGKPLADIVVAPPAVTLPVNSSPLRTNAFFRKRDIEEKNYLVYLGTIQPRKNLENLIEAFEIFSRFHAANQLKKRAAETPEATAPPPQLVLAGKIGWLAQSILDRIAVSPLKKQIILTGFVSDDLKRPLYEQARATVLVGLSEGFGLPPLESLAVGTIPIVSKTSSLPEAVGSAGLRVDPTSPKAIAEAMKQAWNLSANQRQHFLKRAAKQVAQFSWANTGQIIIETLVKVSRHGSHR